VLECYGSNSNVFDYVRRKKKDWEKYIFYWKN
jgi:hypothetical protein